MATLNLASIKIFQNLFYQFENNLFLEFYHRTPYFLWKANIWYSVSSNVLVMELSKPFYQFENNLLLEFYHRTPFLCERPIIFVHSISSNVQAMEFWLTPRCCRPVISNPDYEWTSSTALSLPQIWGETGNSVLTPSVFHGLAANFGFCACVLPVTRHSRLTRLAQKFGTCT